MTVAPAAGGTASERAVARQRLIVRQFSGSLTSCVHLNSALFMKYPNLPSSRSSVHPTTRRVFLKGALAGAAVVGITPLALGRAPRSGTKSGMPASPADPTEFKFREEFLNRELLDTVFEAEVLATRSRKHYNTVRPLSALGYRLRRRRRSCLGRRSRKGFLSTGY